MRIMCCCSSGKLVVALFLIVLFCRTCKALDNGEHKCYSLCGDHNVSSPFRLKDSPDQCGDHKYSLSCEQNQLFMSWQSGKYRVLSINYDNYTILARDSNIVELDSSSLPAYSLTDYNFSTLDPYASRDYDNLAMIMIFVRCRKPVHSPVFLDTAPCFNTSNGSVASSSSSSSYSHSYVNVGSETLNDLGLKDDCLIERMYMTSWPAGTKNQSWSYSCTEIHSMFVYGFQLSWLDGLCYYQGADAYVLEIESNKRLNCGRENPIADILVGILWTIRAVFTRWIWPLPDPPYPIAEQGIIWSILAFCTQLALLYTGAKFVLGSPFVIALLIYKWRRRHLSMYESIEDFLQSDNNNIIPIRYSYKDIKKITKGFNIRLGKGGYGSVFRGKLRSGRDVVTSQNLIKGINNY